MGASYSRFHVCRGVCLALGFIAIGCSLRSAPSDRIDQYHRLPFVDCAKNWGYSIRVQGHSDSSSSLAWAALVKNGIVYAHSEGVPLISSDSSGTIVRFTVPRGTVIPGSYDLMVNLASDPTKVGTLQGQLASANPEQVQFADPLAGTNTCICVRYGDTLKLYTYWNDFSNELAIAPRKFCDSSPTDTHTSLFDTHWDIRNDGSAGFTMEPYFVNLDSGNFYPLKLNDGKRIIWIVSADANGDHAEVEVIVNPQVTLGMANMGYDNNIMAAADSFGVPPTLSKAQIYIENSGFKASAYRYEPRSHPKIHVRGSGMSFASVTLIGGMTRALNLSVPQIRFLG